MADTRWKINRTDSEIAEMSEKLGVYLKRRRMELGLTMVEMADALGVAIATYQRLEYANDPNRGLSISHFAAVAHLDNCTTVEAINKINGFIRKNPNESLADIVKDEIGALEVTELNEYVRLLTDEVPSRFSTNPWRWAVSIVTKLMKSSMLERALVERTVLEGLAKRSRSEEKANKERAKIVDETILEHTIEELKKRKAERT